MSPDRAELLNLTQPGWIDFRQLPLSSGGFSQLFLDYLYDFHEVQRFFPHSFRESPPYDSLIGTIDKRELDRETLVNVLTRQSKSFRCGDRTLEHVVMLGKSTTYAVVTGQQVGLFGGPMYTIFKAVTAIRLSQRLKTKYPSLDFVPLFWIEGEDHDFIEMNNTSVLDGEGKPVRIEYLHGGIAPEKNLGPIGELVFDVSLDQTFASLDAALQKSEFTGSLLEKLKEFYAPGTTFNQAFVGWMNFLFEEYGLVFLSSNDPEIKRLLSPMFVKEITEFPTTSQLVIAQSAELEERYHAQIKPRSVNLFMFHRGGRYLVEPREHDFSLRGTRHFISKEEMLQIAHQTPELLSPNVVLRPVAQDTLLPTVAYVAGPSEIAYHAQLKPVYESFGVSQPVVYPRASGSFVEERLERLMEKYQLDASQLFDNVDTVTRLILAQIAEIKVDDLFGQANAGIAEVINEIQFGLKEIDPTLLGTLEGVRSKINGNIAMLKEKAIGAQKRRNETAIRQIERAMNTLLPNGSLQEREINVLYYMNKYGPELVKWLCSELDISGFKHQLITL